MALTKTVWDSPKDKLLALISLKCDAPRDKPLFKFLRTNGLEFAEEVGEPRSDDKTVARIERHRTALQATAD